MEEPITEKIFSLEEIDYTLDYTRLLELRIEN